MGFNFAAAAAVIAIVVVLYGLRRQLLPLQLLHGAELVLCFYFSCEMVIWGDMTSLKIQHFCMESIIQSNHGYIFLQSRQLGGKVGENFPRLGIRLL